MGLNWFAGSYIAFQNTVLTSNAQGQTFRRFYKPLKALT